jgi:glutamyl-tRNA synthetase
MVTSLSGELHPEGSAKATKLKLTWLPRSSELVPLTCVELGHLITKAKLEDGDNIEDYVNPNSVRRRAMQ